MVPVARPYGAFPVSQGPVNRLDRWFDRMFEDLDRGLTAPAGRAAIRLNPMPLSVWEDEDHFSIEVDLPGIARENVELTVHNGTLTIRTERKPAEGRTYLHNSRVFGRAERVVQLPEAADVGSVQATMNDGVLSLTFARKAEAKPRRIEIEPMND